jgi:superfamily II DNA or RNA helicase
MRTNAIETEVGRALLDHAHGRFGKLDHALFVELALEATKESDFLVQLAALNALIRRFDAIARDGLRAIARPAGGLGDYRVGRRNGETYRVRLTSIDPLVVRCSCPDFVRSSLGICKHGLAALMKAPKRLRSVPSGKKKRALLTWDPMQPMRAGFDRLARLRIEGAVAGVPSGEIPKASLTRLASRAELLGDLSRAIGSGVLDADPSAERVVRDELRRAEIERAAVGALPAAQATLRQLKRRLYKYQREGVLRFLRKGSLLLADDMGLGKTTQAIAACHALMRTRVVKRVLLVAPASLKPQWAREWNATTDVPLVVVDGTPEQRAGIYASTDRGALIVGYEQLLRDIELVRVWGPEVVVLDEAQRIKNWATKSAAIVKSLAPRYRLALTGTPMENRLDELASIVDFVDDVALEPKWRLTPFHTFDEGDAGEGRSGARNLDVLRARLAPIMLRRHRTDVITQLPARTDTRVPVELTDAQRVEHDDLYQPIAKLVSIASKRPLRQEEFLRLMQLFTQQRMIANGLGQVRFDEIWDDVNEKDASDATLSSLFAPKLGAFRSIIGDLTIAQRRKVVVFSQWRAMVRLAEWSVRGLLRDANMRAAFFTGAERPKQREQALVDFHDDPNVSVLFLTDAGGTGLNLQRAASACVQLELPWNPAVLEQRIGRIHRLGQTMPIDVFHLVSEDSIESRIAELVGRKKALFTTLFDGTSEEVRFEQSTSFMSQMRAIYDGRVEASTLAAEEDAIEDPTEAAAVSAPITNQPMEIVPVTSPFRVVRKPDGGLTIDVPPALAPSLAHLFASLADALRTDA